MNTQTSNNGRPLPGIARRNSLKGLAPTVCATAVQSLAHAAGAADGRTILSLDGEWQIESGEAGTKPAAFSSTIPVPGVVKLAKPGWGCPLSPLGQGHEDVLSLGFDPSGKKLPEEEAKMRWEAYYKSHKTVGFPAYWYRRTVRIEGEIPAVAILKINKARWGVKAWVNGKEVGEHNLFRTAGIFDVREALKGGGQENEILLRVIGQAHLAKKEVPTSTIWGGSMPGIYDSVSLILSGAPRVVRVQAAPRLDPAGKEHAVRLAGLLANPSAQAVGVDLVLTVREGNGGREVARSKPLRLEIAAGAEGGFDQTLRMPDALLWSPAHPHLYVLDAEVRRIADGAITDRFTSRFGMREFRIDPKSGAATLNGKHVQLRGVGVLNVTDVMEHPDLGAEPWQDKWIRQALRNVKTDLNGNAVRSAFDFMPERWYEIADEEGVMIQDEALSGARGSKPQALEAMFAQWIYERANHPSVIIWDASNETRDKQELHPAIAAVRHLDLSNRPWDCSWVPTGVPGDVSGEPHPYSACGPLYSMQYPCAAFNKKLKEEGSDPLSAFQDNRPLGPGYIINEYCGVFLRSGGRASTGFFQSMFRTRMKPDAAPEDRWVVRARFQAAETEFWRRYPGCIGVMANPYLHGSDRHFVDDIKVPRIERHFARFVGDAMAARGVMLEFWPDAGVIKAGATVKIPVSVANDGESGWSGNVALAVLKGGRNLFDNPTGGGVMMKPPETEEEIRAATVNTWTSPVTVALGERAVVSFDAVMPAEPGTYLIMAEIMGEHGKPVRSWRDMLVK